MKYTTKNEAFLLLEDGTLFKGYSIGKEGTSGGEICFNTGMTGYQEIYTDPSYFGQIIVNTSSHIGNYGVIAAENESSKPQIAGVVINSFSDVFSRFTGEASLQEYLDSNNVVGICGIDTRKLVRHIRQKGAMNAIISSNLKDIDALRSELSKVPSMEGLELSSVVSTDEPYYIGDSSAPIKVAVMDFGVKKSIVENIANRGCYCKVFPAKTSLEDILTWNPDAFFLSNGPGDPASMPYAVDLVKGMLEVDKPLFGICLGHQILARANGIETFKMHHGHRGINHPVLNLETGLSEVTSQNHGFSVDANSIKDNKKVKITHVNLNDDTIEGIKIVDKKAFSVQYHPEASPGPLDSRYLFDNFIDLINSN
jgi:carbamoyl-phosphate synthase small subunit